MGPAALTALGQLPSLDLPVSEDGLVVLAIIVSTLVLFGQQPVPIDTTDTALMVTLILLGPWTGASPEEELAGFSNPATLTVPAVVILNVRIRRTSFIRNLTRIMQAFGGDDETKQLLAIVGLSGPSPGYVKHTPMVAMLIPTVSDLPRRTNTSRSKVLIPLSSPRCSVEPSP